MLQPHISYQFKSAAWRLDIDTNRNIVFAEIRDPADKKVSFAAININTGQVLFDGLETEERWLTGIETAYNGVLLLHGYQSESSPTHKGLIAIEGETGKTLWNNYTITFDHLSINGPVVYDSRLQPPKLFVIDSKTGAMLRSYEPSIDVEIDNHIALPDDLAHEFWASLPLENEPFGNAVHYLDHNSFRIVSLHTFAEGTLQQHLYIFKGGEIVYQDLLNTGIQKLQPESFLLYKEYLIYLKNQSQLKILNL